MYHPVCNGNESNILNCSYGEQDTLPSSCSQISIDNYRYYRSNNDVTSLICLPGILMAILCRINFTCCKYIADGIVSTNCTDGDIRLMKESNAIPHRGRLEICRGQVWGTVCASRGFSTNDGNTICWSLGYQPFG